MDELEAWMILMRTPGFHAGSLRKLLEQVPSVTELIRASPAWLQVADPALIAADLRWLEQPTHHFLPIGSPRYPALLATLPDAPAGLFVRGDPDVLSLPQLAIVGSRNPTAAGNDNARQFAAHLAQAGLAITSGLAIGIDAAAHRGALQAGRTIAVCGTGLDIDYPRTNAALAAEIASSGALVSEFSSGTPAAKSNFPRRNRIISGLALGTLVVEAAVQSGSLITARLAADQGREVFAIPGSIHNPLARGCHRLIRQGAKLVETADDIFVELRAMTAALAVNSMEPRGRSQVLTRSKLARHTGATSKTAEAEAFFGSVLDKEYEILLDALGFEPASVDVLIARTGLKADEVASMLLILELEAHIDACPGGLYVRRVP